VSTGSFLTAHQLHKAPFMQRSTEVRDHSTFTCAKIFQRRFCS